MIFVGYHILGESHIDIFNNHDLEYLQRIKHERCEFIDVSSDGNHIVSASYTSIVYFDTNSPIILENYLSTFLGIIIPIAITELILISIYIPYRLIKKKRYREDEQKRYTKIMSEQVADGNKINMSKLKQDFSIDDKIFDKKVIEWLQKYDLTIDGDYLIISKENLDDFIKVLEDQFNKWENDSEKKLF